MSGEFKKLKDGEEIYKLVGPVLLKQVKAEAEATVNGRLEFIGKEMYVVFFFSRPGSEYMRVWLMSVIKRAPGGPDQGDPGKD